MTTDTLYARIERVRAMQKRDPNQWAPNPLGPEYLTRRERYLEIIRELERRIRNAETIPGCVWRDAETPFCDTY